MKSRHLVFAALCALPLTVAAAHAAPRDDVRAASLRCDGIAEERTWLNCYYGAAQPVPRRIRVAARAILAAGSGAIRTGGSAQEKRRLLEQPLAVLSL